jgi:hypothetical protein
MSFYVIHGVAVGQHPGDLMKSVHFMLMKSGLPDANATGPAPPPQSWV